MSWKSKANRIYEERVRKDALTRLSLVFDRKSIPFSDDELQTLAKRARESFTSSGGKKARLEKYKDHLSKTYGMEPVSAIASKLEDINNEIGYEEK
ncbi:MAG: hypothetical protein ACREM3_09995 [Candidatus Rokuibacteriota bacterium]